MSQQLKTRSQEDDVGARLDKWLSEVFPDLSRTRAKALIEEGAVIVNGEPERNPKAKVLSDADYEIEMPDAAPASPEPEDIPLEILHEDEHLIVVNKAVGMVVHPAAGAWSGTLVNALLFHCGDTLSGIGGVARPGIVHRLDKDTSGVMVVAKSEVAHARLVERFQQHNMERAYLAITRGAPKPRAGRIENRIERSKTDRKKMAIVRESRLTASALYHDPNAEDYQEKGKHAITNYQTLEAYGILDDRGGLPAAALVECRLETGRTHQIRVQMAHAGVPLVGDQTYGRQKGIKAFGKGDAYDHAMSVARAFPRQALHAAILGFIHPVTKEELRFESEPPNDFCELRDALREMPSSI